VFDARASSVRSRPALRDGDALGPVDGLGRRRGALLLNVFGLLIAAKGTGSFCDAAFDPFRRYRGGALR
jgi:hypothetical protein